ncbi:MAG: methyltransferase domain-containing protein [Acidobacteriaceae bacterium]
MKRTSLELLVCPSCHAELNLQAHTDSGMIETGTLSCSACGMVYRVQHGIPHFIHRDELVGFNRRFAHLYDWFSWIYSAFSRVGLFLLGTSESRARHEVLDRLEPHGGKVLEVSIGPGVNLPILLGSPDVGEVYGLDISIGQLKRCQARLHRNQWDVELFLGNAEQLPFSDGSFDSVFHIGGINFFNDKQRAIDEMIRVSKPGTRIIICDENEAGAQWYEKFLPGFKSSFDDPREAISAPIDLVPGTMLDLHLGSIWNGFMYCLEFRKPLAVS